MHEMSARAVIEATPDEAWAVEADVAGWPAWNGHEQDARLDGPFATGTRGWSKPRGGPAASWTITTLGELEAEIARRRTGRAPVTDPRHG